MWRIREKRLAPGDGRIDFAALEGHEFPMKASPQ
jgi:hypothetical protein